MCCFLLHSTISHSTLLLLQNFKRSVRCGVLSSVSLFLVYNDVFFFLAFNYISFYLLLFSRSDHCRRWKGVMRELLEVTLQRHFVLDRSNSKKKKTRSPLRPSALSEIVGLMQNRSLWPSVMRELAEKYEYKKKECDTPPSQEEENWTDDPSPPARRPTRLPLRVRRRRYCEHLRVRFVPY